MRNNLSEQEIISIAFKYHSEGNIEQAKKYYEFFIKQGFMNPGVFSNYAIILNQEDKKDKAIELYRQSIKLFPKSPEAYSNLGTILKDNGNTKEAEILTRKAIELKPNFVKAYHNLGGILHDIGKLEEAEKYLNKAINLEPNFLGSYQNLGLLMAAKGSTEEAINIFFKAININPKNSDNYILLSGVLAEIDASIIDKGKLKKILIFLLERDDIAHKDLFNCFNSLYNKKEFLTIKSDNTDISNIDIYQTIFNDNLLIQGLKKIIFRDLKWERFLTLLRTKLCYLIAHNINELKLNQREFIFALAQQCFLNEYVYSLNVLDLKLIKIIINKCNSGNINEEFISILACYYPLYKLIDNIKSIESVKSSNDNFKELIKLQLIEPNTERKLSSSIKELGSITDDISKKVKLQYENNPYPRWRYSYTNLNNKVIPSVAINAEIKPNSVIVNLNQEKVNVLIAGCGTGNQILQAQRYNNAHITAIDLSISSLAYAQRKLNEIGVRNVELIKMDILEVSLLKKKFEIIECGGVLHHMNNPSIALNRLSSILAKKGFIKLGLYSELARREIVLARKYIQRQGYDDSEDGIRKFREDVFSLKEPQIINLKNWMNLYTTSECRDLCFHRKEHRFTISQLDNILKLNNLKFIGFLLPKKIKSLYKKYFPEDHKQVSLQNWHNFEQKYPDTFRGMYQFWASSI